MEVRRVAALLALVALFAAPLAMALKLPSQNKLQFPNFFDTTTLLLQGTAGRFHRKAIRLTPLRLHQRGMAMLRTPVLLLDKKPSSCQALAWESYFSFRLAGNSDGFAFVVNPNIRNLGSADGNLGYGGNVTYKRASFAVEFDTFKNAWDPAGFHVGFNTKSSVVSVATAPIKDAELLSGAVRHAWINYDGKRIAVYFSSGHIKPPRAIFTHTVDLCDVLGQNAFYTGFSASTGGQPAVHDILSWTLSTSPAGFCDKCGSILLPSAAVGCCPPFRCCDGVCLSPAELCSGTTCCGNAANGRVCWGGKCCSVTSLCTTRKGRSVCCNEVNNSTCCL